jgi:hypothetical protein
MKDKGATASQKSHQPKSHKRRAIRARLLDPVTLALRLRLGLGVGVKADLICFLLAGRDDWMTVKEIVTATGYTSTGVRRAADDLTNARLLHSNEGQPTAYRADRRAWGKLLSLETAAPVWPDWRQRFAFIIAFNEWAKRAKSNPISPYAFGVRGRELIERHRPVFEAVHPFVFGDSWRSEEPVNFVEQSVMRLSSRMTQLA